MSLTLTELLVAAALLIGALLLGIWIGSLIWKKYKNLAEEWSREYHEKLEMYTSLQEAHDTLNAQFTKDRDAISGIQTKLEASINERAGLERQMGEMRQQQEQLQQQLANAREEARQAQQHASGEVDSIKAELEAEKSRLEEARKRLQEDREALSKKIIATKAEKASAMASPSPEAQGSQPVAATENEPRAEADRQRLAELENSIGRLKKQILLLMPFQGKFERALKDMESLKQAEAHAKEKAARAEASVQASKAALKEASQRLKQLGDVEERYHTAQNNIHKLNLSLGIVRPYKEQAEKLEKKVRSLNSKIKKLQDSNTDTRKPASKKPPQADKAKTAKKPAANKSTSKKPATKKPAAKKAATKKPAVKKPETKKSNKAETLKRIQAKSSQVDFEKIGTASASVKDDLKKIKGIGPFLEEKLNSIGIYTFDQISRFTPTIEKKVNEIIEFFPGRIKRDQWKKQATHLLKEKNKD